MLGPDLLVPGGRRVEAVPDADDGRVEAAADRVLLPSVVVVVGDVDDAEAAPAKKNKKRKESAMI
jgi:hypothetical protein